ncbi:CHAD domain-containing protein [Liquorilactobacillus sicerae]|uniref:CHAD domain-containing protein n=1 Tax=Liquorilactobacillus sicerae TaxID=1416943 RepID=UPI0024816867|nr:CHAD domain-containing protein [Liquorilactobacillus sicerae]
MKSIMPIFQRQFQQIQIERTHFLNNPYDPERTHALRVSLRTLRGLFKFLKRQLPATSFATIDQNLSQAAKLLGPLREIDVLIEKSSQYALKYPSTDTSSNYYQLFKMFHQQRQQIMEQVLTTTTQTTLKNCLITVKQQLAQLKFQTELNWSKLLTQQLKKRQKKIIKAYRHLDLTDYPQVHQIRKKAKTLRYSATYFADFISQAAIKTQAAAEKIQDTCGVITDAHVNYGLLQDLAAKITDPQQKDLLLKIAHEQEKIYQPTAKSTDK